MNWPVFIVFDNHNLLSPIFSGRQWFISQFSAFSEEVCKKNAKECRSISWWFVPHILRDSPPQAPWAPPPLFVAAFLRGNHFFSPTLRTTPENLGCVHFLLHMIHMLTGDFFWSWGLFYRLQDGDVAQVSSSVQNNFVNYIELQRNEEIPWARLTLKILFFMQILFFLEAGYTCFVCFSERWKSTLFNLKCI